MKRYIVIVAMLAMAIASSGCAYMSLKKTQNDINASRVMASGDKTAIRSLMMGTEPENAIKAVRLDNGGVGIGVDLLSSDVLSTNTLRHLGGALLDAGAMYLGYQAVQSATQSGNANQSKNTTYNISPQNADHTSITINNNETTTTTTTTSTTDNHSGNGNNR